MTILTFGNLSLADISIPSSHHHHNINNQVKTWLQHYIGNWKLTLTACFHELREFSCVDMTLFLVEVPPDHSRQHWECGVVWASLEDWESRTDAGNWDWDSPMLGGRNVKKFSAAYNSSRAVIRPRLSGNFSIWLSSSLRVTQLIRDSKDSGTCCNMFS